MTDDVPVARSPELMGRDDTALLVVDMQERLLPHIADHQIVQWNVGRLIDGARILGVPVFATEQYPQGLGPTVAELAERLGDRPSKLTFSCAGCEGLFRSFRDQQRHKILVTGTETHVCVQQTVLDLLAEGFRAYVAVDAVGSRTPKDRDTALRRMESSGAVLTTAEAALFEWCAVAGSDQFKQISKLVRATEPS